MRSKITRLDRFARFGNKPPGGASVPLDPFPITSLGLQRSLESVGTWDHIWDCEETTGNLVDEVGARTLTKNAGAAVYSMPGPSTGKRAVQLGANGTGFATDFASGVVGTQSYAVLMTFCVPTFNSSRAIMTFPSYGAGTGWKHPVLIWTSSTSTLEILTYNAAGSSNETSISVAGLTPGTWHDVLLCYKSDADFPGAGGMRLHSSFASAGTDTTPFSGTWPDWNGSFTANFLADGSWGVNSIIGSRMAYAAITFDATAVDDLYTNGTARLTAFRALRTVSWPSCSNELYTANGVGGNNWLSLAHFDEASGNAYDDNARLLTATGVSGDDTITYRADGPVAGKYAVQLRDTGAGAGTAARFTYANGVLHPAASSFAALCVFKVDAADTTTRTLFGIATGGAYWRVRMSGTTGLLTFQVFDGTLSNAVTGSVDHHGQWVVCLVIFDQSTDTLYLTTGQEDVSVSGVSLGSISNAGAPLTIGSTDCHKTTSFAFFAYTQTITGLVAGRTDIVSNFAAAVGM